MQGCQTVRMNLGCSRDKLRQTRDCSDCCAPRGAAPRRAPRRRRSLPAHSRFGMALRGTGLERRGHLFLPSPHLAAATTAAAQTPPSRANCAKRPPSLHALLLFLYFSHLRVFLLSRSSRFCLLFPSSRYVWDPSASGQPSINLWVGERRRERSGKKDNDIEAGSREKRRSKRGARTEAGPNDRLCRTSSAP